MGNSIIPNPSNNQPPVKDHMDPENKVEHLTVLYSKNRNTLSLWKKCFTIATFSKIHSKAYQYYKTGGVDIFQNGDNLSFFYTANHNYRFQKNSMLYIMQAGLTKVNLQKE